MSYPPTPAPWRATSVLMELSRTIKDPCMGELLYCVPAILKVLQEHDPGNAADELCTLLTKSKWQDIVSNRFPDLILCCERFIVGKPMSKKKEKEPVMKLLKDLLETRHSLRSEGAKHSSIPAPINLRNSALSVGGRSRSNTVTRKKPRSKKSISKAYGRKGRKKPNLFQRSGLRPSSGRNRNSSITSYDSTFSNGSRRDSRADYMDLIKSDNILTMFLKYSKQDIQIVLLFILSSYHNRIGLLPTEKVQFWLKLTTSPMFESRTFVLNQLNNDFSDISKTKAFSLLILDELLSFIWRNSVDKPHVGHKFGPIVFDCQSSKDSEAAGRFFNRILYTCDILLPVLPSERHRIWSIDNKDDLSTDDVQDSVYYYKKQLETFYRRLNEKRYILIIDQLFKLYKFQDIAVGIYSKYHFGIEEWKHKIRDKVSAEDLPDLDLSENINPKHMNYRARPRANSSLRFSIEIADSKNTTNIREIESRILNKEIDFNERLRVVEEKFVQKLEKQVVKARSIVFNSDFYNMLEVSNRIAVKLEVLNLVRKPIMNSVHDLSSITLYGVNSSNPTIKQSPAVARALMLSRHNILCDVYLDCIEMMYHGFAPFILHLERCKSYIEVKSPLPSNRIANSIRDSARTVQRSFQGLTAGVKKGAKLKQRDNGGVMDRRQPNSSVRRGRNTQPVRGSGRRLGSQPRSNNRSQSLHDEKPARARPGKLTGDDRNNNNTLFTQRAKKDSKKPRSMNRTGGSILSMVGRPKRTLITAFEEAKEQEEVLNDQSLLKILSEPERRFDDIRLGFDELSRNVDKSDPVFKKAKRIASLVKELQGCLEREKNILKYCKRQYGETEVEERQKKVLQRVKVDDIA